MQNSALLMVEFQNEWLSNQGKLKNRFEDRNLLATALKNAKKALDYAHAIHMPVIYTSMGFSPNYAELGQTDFGLRGLIPKAKTWQKDGHDIHIDFKPQSQDYIIADKKVGSAFAHTDLDLYLRTHDIKRLYITGFALHVCILATAWSAHDLGYEVVIIEDAVAAFNKHQQEFVLKELVHHFGHVETTKQFTLE